MYHKLLAISIILTLTNGASSFSSYLPEEQNFHKMNMERNNKVNTGIWKRGSRGDSKIYHGDFLFPGAAQDVESLGDEKMGGEFGDSNNNMNNEGDSAAATFFSRLKRDVAKNADQESPPCRGNEANCIETTEKTMKITQVKPEFISKLKPASVFNEYPYEIAVLLNDDLNEIEKADNNDLKRNDVEFKVVPLTDGKDYVDIYVTPTDKIVDINEIYAKIKQAANHTINTIDSSIGRKSSDYETEIMKNMILTDNANASDDNSKLNRNVIMGILNKDHQPWPQKAPKIDGKLGEVITSKGKSTIASKSINGEGLIKVLSMLTKTFKKVMKQHEDIKEIHGKFHATTNDFTKNIDDMTKKFDEFEEKYKLLIELTKKFDTREMKLQDRYKHIEQQQKELAKNLAEFFDSQMKFVLQQKEFYDIQKTILAQNENINQKQTIIARSQNIVSRKQSEFARIIQKVKKLYNARKNVKLIPNITVKKQQKTLELTTTAKPEKTSVVETTEPVKINLFSIPVKEKLKNQDEHILSEKDEQSIDDIVYKFYFNNTFIDNLLKTGVLASFVNEPNSAGKKDLKKRSREDIEKLLETTVLLPVTSRAETVAPMKRQKRWLNRSNIKDKRFHVKPPTANRFKFYDDSEVQHKKKSHKTAHNKHNKEETVTEKKVLEEIQTVKANNVKNFEKKPYLDDVNDPYRLMATNFCNQIKQNTNNQILNWCIEKALRKLQAIDVKMSLQPLAKDNERHAMTSDNVEALAKTIHTFRKFKPSESPLVRSNTDSTPTPQSVTDTGRSNAYEVTSTPTAQRSQDLSGFFPDNDKLESNLKQYELVPDSEGTVYYDGSLHSSKMMVGPEDEAASDIMPGMDSNSHVDIDPHALEIQAQRRAYVRKIPAKSRPMTRCANDGVFRRIFYVTLLAIAVTFTVILTNVFVDIDALINSRILAPPHQDAPVATEFTDDATPGPPQTGLFDNEDEDRLYDNDGAFRTKRSLEAQNYQHYPKNPKITKLLTRRLATLLEELDTEYTSTPNYETDQKERDEKTKYQDSVHRNGEGTDLLRLTVHNILLDGVVNHVDFSEIYKEIQAFQQAFKQMYPNSEWGTRRVSNIEMAKTLSAITSTPVPKVQLVKKELFDGLDDEDKVLYEELLKCAELKAQIKRRMEKVTDSIKVKIPKIDEIDRSKKEPKFIINTHIDIETAENENSTLSKDDFEAVVNVSYNGKPIIINHDAQSITTAESQSNKENNVNMTFMNNFFKDYFKMFSLTHDGMPSYSEISKIETKRLKRHIKLRFTDQNDSDKEEYDKYDNTIVKRTGSADDELFVEIKTFFNNNTVKGDKKRKLIETLIEKIEKAVHSDLPVSDHKHRKKVTFKHWNIKKRLQNPLKQHNFRTRNAPLHITPRHTEAIGKANNRYQSHDEVIVAKEPDNDYIRVKIDDVKHLDFNTEQKYDDDDKYKNVAQRLKVPLNINKDLSNETLNDLHKLKFLIKNIDGSGFSIGFNQYSDEPPDPESIKLFTGLDHLIRTYHQQYDEIDEDKENGGGYGSYENYFDQNHVMVKRSVDFTNSNNITTHFGDDLRHVKLGSSLVHNIFGNEKVSSDNYIDRFYDENQMNNIELHNETDEAKHNQDAMKKIHNETDKVSKKIYNIQPHAFWNTVLKPVGYLNLVESSNRGKRSIEHLKNLTLKDIIRQQREQNAKRRKIKNKRQVVTMHSSANPDYEDDRGHEYYSTNEHARRAIIAHMRKAELHDAFKQNNDAFNRPNPLLPPLLYQQNPSFENYRRTNSKAPDYPHVFQDSKPHVDQEEVEEYFPAEPTYKISPISNDKKDDRKEVEVDSSDLPNFKDIVAGYNDKNYKITVKVLPKQFHKDETVNGTETLAGFKEIHTSINKSYNRDGKRVRTTLNISEVSHIEELSNSTHNQSAKPQVSETLPVLNHMVIKQEQNLDPQDHMKGLLTEHKNIINNQLVHLEKEKRKIDDMLSSDAKLIQRPLKEDDNLKILENATALVDLARKYSDNELLDITLPFQPPKVLRLTKEEIGNILSTAMRVQNDVKMPCCPKKEGPTRNTQLDKIINENINLTHEVLKKINKNTDMLEKFLKKLTSDKRVSALLKRNSVVSAEMINSNGNVLEIVKDKNKRTEEPLQLQMLPVDIKTNEGRISKSVVKTILLQNGVETRKTAENEKFAQTNTSTTKTTVKPIITDLKYVTIV